MSLNQACAQCKHKAAATNRETRKLWPEKNKKEKRYGGFERERRIVREREEQGSGRNSIKHSRI